MLTPAEAHRGATSTWWTRRRPLAPCRRGRGAFASSWSAAPAAPMPAWPLVAVLVALGLAGARKPRRALALALVVIVAIFALESGVHSVHHLTDVDRGESCAVASASQHISGTEVDVSWLRVAAGGAASRHHRRIRRASPHHRPRSGPRPSRPPPPSRPESAPRSPPVVREGSCAPDPHPIRGQGEKARLDVRGRSSIARRATGRVLRAPSRARDGPGRGGSGLDGARPRRGSSRP